MFESFFLVNVYETNLLVFLVFFQAFKYLLIFLPPALLLLIKGYNRDWGHILILYTLILLAYALYSILVGRGADVLILSIKNVYLWVWYFLFFCTSRATFDVRFLKILYATVVICTVLNVAYSLFIEYSFSGDPSIFYFYEFYLSKGIYSSWNFYREDGVRAFGFLGSPLTFSQALLLPILFCFISVIFRKYSLGSIVYFFLFLLLLIGLFITKTRNPAFALFLSVLLFITAYLFRLKNASFVLAFLIFYSLSFYLVLEINSRGAGDLSSQARIPMFLQFFDKIKTWPWGYGIGSTGISSPNYEYFFESSVATIFMDLGIVGGGWFFYILFRAIYYLRIVAYGLELSERWVVHATSIAVVALLFLTNFSNIFDSTLFLYSIVLAVSLKVRA